MNTHKKNKLDPGLNSIAVIGIGCRYPGARNPAELWENILGRRRQFRRMPDVRLPISEYQSNERSAPDKTYGTRAAVIDGYSFNWAEKRIPKQTYESTDIAHWLALDVVLQMLQDTGYSAADLPRATTQVVVGNTLTGEFTRANTLRSRWPFVHKILAASAADLKLPASTIQALSTVMERSFKSVFAPVNEDTLAGGLANTIAGRICNYLNVHGGGYVVDGACASSLIAVYSAATSLANLQCDFAIAGGVDISLDPFELVGFAKTGALTPNEMSVYDKRGNGFIPGEGCGFVAMKRLADALRDGDKVYAVLDGWGMSSDGKGGITAPSVDGQSLALKRAYQHAGIDPAELDFIEGHGTGTTVGDKTELLGIARALESGSTGKRSCGVTSFKSIVGHTKAAAGIGAFIKAVMAVNQRVIPPTAGCALPHEVFSHEAACLYPVLRGQTFAHDQELRAGVSAMGFGGINLHVTLKSGAQALAGLAPCVGERPAMVSHQEDEVYCFTATSVETLCESIRHLQTQAADASLAELADLACAWNRNADPASRLRAAIVAGSPQELSRKTNLLLAHLAKPPAQGDVWIDADNLIVACNPSKPVTLGYAFPGQGSQRLGMARTLVERFDWAATLVSQADMWATEAGTPGLAASLYPDLDRQLTSGELELAVENLQRTQLAQPAIVLCSLLWLKYLDHLGLAADCVVGHSLGELTAFFAAGAFDEKTLIQLATLRGQLMANSSDGPAGAMVSLGCTRQRAQQLLDELSDRGLLVIANINGESQTVVSGDAGAAAALYDAAVRAAVPAHRLPVSNAFHSPLVASAATALRARAALPATPAALGKLLISSCDGALIDNDIDLRDHFSLQITRPVDFVAATQNLRKHCDLAFEVGPGSVLSNMITRSSASGGLLIVPIERQAESSHDLNWLLALAHAHGRDIHWNALYERRIIRPFVPANKLEFIVNPCERPFERAATTSLPAISEVSTVVGQHLHVDGVDLENYLAQRGGFIADVIKADLKASGLAPRTAAVETPALAASRTAIATPATPASQGVGSGNDMRTLVMQLAAAATGFPADQITLSMTLLDDLNLDSIKSSALIAEAFAAAGVSEQIDSAATAGLTLGQLAEHIDALRPRVNAIGSAARVSALDVLLALTTQYTGFAAASLQPNLSFVDDLNLDSIKFAALLSEATAKLGIEGKIAASDVTVKSIGELATLLESLITPGTAPVSQSGIKVPNSTLEFDAASNAWVRSFEMRRVPATRTPPQPTTNEFEGSVVAIQCDHQERPNANALAQAFVQQGATVLVLDADGLLAESRRDINHFVVVLRREPSTHWYHGSLLPDAVRRLRTAAVVSARQTSCSSLAYLQFGGLSEGSALAKGNLQTSCAASFAASIHLERPELRVRVLDFHPVHNPDFIAAQTLAEMSLADYHALSHYDESGERYMIEARLVEPHLQPPTSIVWDASSDVVLVTGGAKGITAECAFAFAKATGVRVVLVGSSPYVSETIASSEISDTLSRYENAGLSASYLQCDIANTEAVNALIENVELNLGPVTGVIHGAGINKPRRVEQCSEEEALREIAPKLRGIINICAALDQKPVKLIAGLASIIGITGMPGNAWYAFSNEALNLCLQNYRTAHPYTHIVSLAYSVWAEVGMGAKLGSTKHLAKMGIAAIPPEQGVTHFMAAVMRQAAANQIVIASRLGGLDTWRTSTPAHAAGGRFIEDIVAFEAGVELVNRVRLTLNDDLYLRDHYYRGVYLFPTVFGLEAMAQAVAKVLAIDTFTSLRLENIGLQRPIIVASGEAGALIQMSALVVERDNASDPVRVQVGIRTQHTGFRVDHFNATFILQPEDALQTLGRFDLPETATDIEPLTQLYGGLLFQGPLFQRLRKIWAMDWDGALVDIERRAHDDYYAPHHSQRSMLGDPALRDVLLQSVQLSEKGVYLPVHIDSLRIYSVTGPDKGMARARSRINLRRDDERICEVAAISEEGTPIEQLSGYRLKRMEYDPLAATPEDYVNPQQRDAELLRKALDAACETLGVTLPEHLLIFYPKLSQMDRSRRRLSELPFFSEVILKAFPTNRGLALDQLEIQWQEDGKPILRGLGRNNLNVSLSHDRTHCLCVAGDGAQGCDIETITPRTQEQWVELLGTRYLPLLRELIAAGDTLDEAGTRLWSAIESAKKALDGDALQLRMARREAKAVIFACTTSQNSAHVLTLAFSATRLPRKMVAMVTLPAPESVPIAAARAPLAQGAAPEKLLYARMASGPHGQRKPCFRFMTTFKDITTLRHGLDFPVFASWMGNIRELGIIDVASHLVPDFASGRWGMVTNESNIQIIADAQCLDIIEGRVYISRAYGKYNSSIDMHFEWLKIHPDGSEQPIALSTMATTWVEIKGHGIVDVQPFPAYLETFIADALPQQRVSGDKPHTPRLEGVGSAWAQTTELGDCLYEAPNAPKIEPELMRQTFATTSAESNLVGNIYFANYYHWQKRLIDRFFYNLSPPLFTAGGKIGEFHFRQIQVRHLREAMPFDQIEVVMALKTLHRDGIKLHFDFYKLTPAADRIKLAFGDCEAVWVQDGAETPSQVPALYRSALLGKLTATV